MKKKISWLLVIAVFLTALIAGIWLYSPRQVDVRLEGVKYRLGTIDPSEMESAAIHIDGTVRRTITGQRLFRGVVEIDGEPMPVPREQMRTSTFSARKGESFVLVYQWIEKGDIGRSFHLGELYADDDFHQITLTLFEQGEDGQSSYWGGDNGLMLTAPAKDRTEAIGLANRLMADRLQGAQPLK